MRVIRRAVQWLSLAGGLAAFFGNAGPAGNAPYVIGGAILADCAVIGISVDRG